MDNFKDKAHYNYELTGTDGNNEPFRLVGRVMWNDSMSFIDAVVDALKDHNRRSVGMPPYAVDSFLIVRGDIKRVAN